MEATHTGGSGFWGYDIYRENPGTTTYGLVGQVAENTSATSTTTYSFTDTGATAPGARPGLRRHLPHRHQPRHRLLQRRRQLGPGHQHDTRTPPSSRRSAWTRPSPPPTSCTNYTPAAVVTGEHSGLENPNMPAALAGYGHHHLRLRRLPPAASPTRSGPPCRHPATRATSTTTPATGPTSSTSTTPCTWPAATRRQHRLPERDRPLRGDAASPPA